MSAYYVNLVAVSPKQQDLHTEPVRVLVDTGSELSWLPREAMARIGVDAERKRIFRLANGETMARDVGFAILEAEGYRTIDEVVFAEPGDMHLLGVRTIEGFGVMVDALAHRFVATATLAVSAAPPT